MDFPINSDPTIAPATAISLFVDAMLLPRRVLVTGGAGFIGSHLCERLLEIGCEVLCVDNFFTGTRRSIEQLLDHPRFELFAARCNTSPPCRSRRDLQSRLSGLARSLSMGSGANDQDERAGRH